MEIGLEGLGRNACALDLVTCGGIREVSEIAGRRSLCGLPGLKSLTITRFEWITELVQNLEEIKVSDCRKMKCIIERNVSDGLLRKLKVIEIRNLINLKTICSRESAWPVLERIRGLSNIEDSHILCFALSGRKP
ncbi:disease resistance protein At4g27190-like [Fagus crenata]